MSSSSKKKKEKDSENKIKDLQDKLAKLRSKAGYQESDLVNYVRKAATISKNIDNELEARNEQLDNEEYGTEGESYNRSVEQIKSVDQSKIKSPVRDAHFDDEEGTITRAEHKKLLERELKKVESRFFGVLKSEKEELQAIHERELKIMQEKLKEQYIADMKELEFRAKNQTSLLQENENLRRELRLLQNRGSSPMKEGSNLELENRRLRERIIELENKIRETVISELFTRVNLEAETSEAIREMRLENERLKEIARNEDKVLEENRALKIKMIDLEEELERSKKKNEYLKDQLGTHRSFDSPQPSQKPSARKRPNSSKVSSIERSKSLSSQQKKRSTSKPKILIEDGNESSTITKGTALGSNPGSQKKRQEKRQKDRIELENMKEQLERIYDELNTIKRRNNHQTEGEGAEKRYSSKEGSNVLVNALKEKEEEIEFWKNRCRLLSLKFADAIKSLRAESQSIKQEMFSSIVEIAKETETTLRKYLHNPKTKVQPSKNGDTTVKKKVLKKKSTKRLPSRPKKQ